MICKKCNSKIPDDSLYCICCGTNIEDEPDSDVIIQVQVENLDLIDKDELNENPEEAPPKKRKLIYTKLKIIISAATIFFLILISVFIFNNKTDIQHSYWKFIRDDKSLLRYFNENYKVEENQYYVSDVINYLGELDSDIGYDRFKDILSDNSFPYWIKCKAADNFIANSDRIPDLDYLIVVMINADMDVAEGNKEYIDKLLTLINNYPSKEIENCFMDKVKDSAETMEWNEVNEMVENYNNYFSETQVFSNIYALLTDVDKQVENLIEMDKKILVLEGNYRKAKNDYDEYTSKLTQLKQERDQAYNVYIESENNYYNSFNLIYLDIYIVGVLSDDGKIHQYEVCPASYNYYGDKVLSTDRAILITSDVTYTSKGWANPSVIYTGNQEIQLKEEFGSFNQDWPVYVEESLYNNTIGAENFALYETARVDYEDAEQEYSSWLELEQSKVDNAEEKINICNEVISDYNVKYLEYQENRVIDYNKVYELLGVSTNIDENHQLENSNIPHLPRTNVPEIQKTKNDIY